MSEKLNGLGTPVLIKNLVTRTQRMDSNGSSRSIGSPIETFRQTQERYNKANNGSGILADNDEDVDFQNVGLREQTMEPRISISESCIESESDSEGENRGSSPASAMYQGNNNSNISIEQKIKKNMYRNVFSSSTSSLDAVEEQSSDEESAIMKDEREKDTDDTSHFHYKIEGDDDDDDGRLPSAGNYLTGLKGSQSTVNRTDSISNSQRPTMDLLKDNMEHNIVARASQIHKYKERTASSTSGLIHKNRRTSNPNSSRNEAQLLLRNQSYSSQGASNLNSNSCSFDKSGVPLLTKTQQSEYYISQFIYKYPSYMKNNLIENLKEIHLQQNALNEEFDEEEYVRFMEYPTANLLEMMSCLLTKIVETNDELGKNTTLNNENGEQDNLRTTDFIRQSKTLLFRGQNIPHFPINKYLQRAHQYCATSNDVYLSLLVYFDKLSQPPAENFEPKLILDSYNIHRLIITAFTVATKFSQDIYFTNKRYAKVGGISDRELNKLELAFLDLLKWEGLRCSGTQLLKYWKLLNGFWEREKEKDL
ncbi:hypothetical protein QEN19_003066 [Hanseniaspora menglaensis]